MNPRMLSMAMLLAAFGLAGCYTQLGTVREEPPMDEETWYSETDTLSADEDYFVTEEDYENQRDRLYYEYYSPPAHGFYNDPWYWTPSWGWSYWYGSSRYWYPSSYFWYWPGAVGWVHPGYWYPYRPVYGWHEGTARSTYRNFGTTRSGGGTRTLGGARGEPGGVTTRGGEFTPLPSGGAVQRPAAGSSAPSSSSVNTGKRGQARERSARSAAPSGRERERAARPAQSTRKGERSSGVSPSRPNTGKTSAGKPSGRPERSYSPPPPRGSAPRSGGGSTYTPPPPSRAPEGRPAPASSSGSGGRTQGQSRSGGRR